MPARRKYVQVDQFNDYIAQDKIAHESITAKLNEDNVVRASNAAKIDDICEKTNNIQTALVGLNGKGGLIDAVEENSKRVSRLRQILAFLLGSGVLTGAGFSIASLVG